MQVATSRLQRGHETQTRSPRSRSICRYLEDMTSTSTSSSLFVLSRVRVQAARPVDMNIYKQKERANMSSSGLGSNVRCVHVLCMRLHAPWPKKSMSQVMIKGQVSVPIPGFRLAAHHSAVRLNPPRSCSRLS